MSRLAKKPIIIPPKTEASFSGGILTVKGPLGTLAKPLGPSVTVAISEGKISFAPADQTLETKALIGTYVSHTKNMLSGVNKPYEKKLVVEGIGFKAEVKGKDLVMSLGFSHPVSFPIPADLKVVSEKNVITITGMDRDKVGKFAADVRAAKKPEPYLGKGVRYDGEVIRRKQGKKAA